jgi:hypothetical protein
MTIAIEKRAHLKNWNRPSYSETLKRVDPEWSRAKKQHHPMIVRPGCVEVWTTGQIHHITITRRVTPSAAQRTLFNKLVRTWRHDTASSSVLTQKINHRAYQEIIKIGKPAIPLILEEMERVPGHWFWALEKLTNGKNPAIGSKTLTEAASAWIKWGKAEDYI